MKTYALKKIIFGATVFGAALCACLLPQNSSAQTPPDNAAQPEEPATLPSDILPSSPLAQVIKLAQAGVSENVILSYISNSSGPFSLTTDQIIYLKDIGLPDEAVTAMIQRDQQSGATSTDQTPPPATTAETVTEQPAEVTQNYFYDTLSPYGNWVDVEGYGLCWRPTAVIYDSAWQPYCDHGHWIYTDDGWFWVSDYSWGACAFHYGRWFHDPRWGWCWWPDTVWAPSWVTWRYADDYCGWAPLPPRTVYREGVGIVYGGATIGAGFDFGISVDFFTFVPTKDFCDPHPERFRVPHDRVAAIYGRTTVINNFNASSRDHALINVGIAPDRISAVTRTPVPRVTIRETSAPDRRGELPARGEVIVNRPHFNGDPAVSLHQDAVPRTVQVNRPSTPRPPVMNGNRNNPGNPNPAPRNVPPQQNNFSQPGNFSQPERNPPPAQRPPEIRPETPRANGSPYQQPENVSPPAERDIPPQARTFQPENRPVTPPVQTPAPSQRIAPPVLQQQQPPQPRIVPDENRQTPVAPPVERPREEQRPNYSAPPQRIVPSAPPAQAQPSGSQQPQQPQQQPGGQNQGRGRNKDNGGP